MPLTVMALLASTCVSVPVSLLTPKVQIQIKNLSVHSGHQICKKCSRKAVITAQVSEPNNAKEKLENANKRLWEAVPDPVKEFPWKQAVNIVLERVFFLGKKSLKWSLVTLLIFSSVSDFVFSISTNQELMIPFGILIGCLMADFFRETLHHFCPISEGKGLQRQFLSIICFFVLVKLVSAYFAVKQQVLLLHVANGGLMQVLWPWRNLMEENENDHFSEENSNSTSNENATA